MENENRENGSVTEFVIISMQDYMKFVEIKTRYTILADHVKSVLSRGGSHYDFQDGLFRAVIGEPEKKEGDVDA